MLKTSQIFQGFTDNYRNKEKQDNSYGYLKNEYVIHVLTRN